MLDRDELMYQRGSKEPAGKISIWIPPKTKIEEVRGFQIFRSDPFEIRLCTVQVAVVSPDTFGDMFRADSYQEGYFASTWVSTVRLPQFLETAENYFKEFEQQFVQEPKSSLYIFSSGQEPQEYEFERPLVEEDFIDAGISLFGDSPPHGYLRIETKPGDLCYDPQHKEVGLVAYLDEERDQPTIAATARFVNRTQPQLPEDVISRALLSLPYRQHLQ